VGFADSWPSLAQDLQIGILFGLDFCQVIQMSFLTCLPEKSHKSVVKRSKNIFLLILVIFIHFMQFNGEFCMIKTLKMCIKNIHYKYHHT